MKKISFPTTRLAELAARDGGITRNAAVEGALKSIESMRTQGDEVIENAIAAIEAIAYAPHPGHQLSTSEMLAILRGADQIVTLAGTFCYESLDCASRSLCDVADGMLGAGKHDIAPIIVHVQAIRLMAPGGAMLSPTETVKMLAELSKILTHFEFTSISDQHGGQDVGDAAVAEG